MTHSISITENLKNIEVGPTRSIAVSSITLLNAGIFANSIEECAEEAKRIYKKHNNGGMWKKVQAEAKRIITIANNNNLTFDKPYIIKNGMVYVLLGDSLVAICGSEKL